MRERLLVGLILAVALGLRLWLIFGPYREIDADEAVVGLMALEMPGELPVFFWQQEYLGSGEAFLAASLFALVGPSTAALKVVPALVSVVFIGLMYLTARHAFGPGPALLSALYLAVPPSFFAVWSTKARGGYAELLALGQLWLLAVQRLSDSRSGPSLVWSAIGGLAVGLALWTHPLAVIYVLAGGLYLLFGARRWRTEVPEALGAGEMSGADDTRGTYGRSRLVACLVVGCAAALVGFGPALVYNVANGFPSLRFAGEGGTEPRAALLNLWGLVRYGLPVLVGLAEGTPTKALLDQDWPHRVGSSYLVTALLPLLGLGVVWWHRCSLRALVVGSRDPLARRPALFVLVLLLVPAFAAVSRFANLWAEPRYALPIYSAVPLVMALVWAVRVRSRIAFGALAAGLLTINLVSLVTSDFRLSLPTSGGATTADNRAELIAWLEAHSIDRIYTDYWLAYPIALESREAIVPAVWSGGFSRRASYSHLVSVAPDPAFVFAHDTPGDQEFCAKLAAVGGTAEVTSVGIYQIYADVQPLERMRRP